MTLFSLFRCDRMGRRLLMVGLACFLSLTSFLTIAVQPSLAQIPFDSKEAHGQTKDQLTGRTEGKPLSAEERLNRAYDMSEATGIREEMRQAEGKVDPEEDNESLVEKATDAVKRATGASGKSN
ncbi:hypothetical protein H6F75_23245 [Nodosilinea sp. FACHB-131]|uniref:hypothetical protein n=1 Tax=Cyanophyceae TaxID=3028117 RepID=UPI0016856530|nr:hypothetical protein [Nodosilinea sp. FACHB-131]MBD1876409.1 hypothetical protein [Nodosilinea sp. FACHB-131]